MWWGGPYVVVVVAVVVVVVAMPPHLDLEPRFGIGRRPRRNRNRRRHGQRLAVDGVGDDDVWI